MATPYQGGAALGDILFGGRDRGNSDVFLKRLRENYTTQKAMEEASTSQIQRIARESQTAETVAKATGLPLGQAAMIANALRSQQSMNLNTAGVTPLQMQEHGLRSTAVEALTPDLGAGNAALAAIDGKPLKRNDIDSGYQLDPYAVGGTATPTGLQLEREGTERAKQGELGERANLSRVKAAGGGFAPSRAGGGGGGGKGRSPSAAKAIIGTLEKEMGRKLTADEVDTIYAGGDFKFDEPALGEVATKTDPARQAEVMQALKDARAAVATGKITKEEARKRLIAAGYKNIAARL